MSVEIMAEVWKQSKLEGTELLMLLAIADHSNDDRECWPSMTRLARKCRVSERQAQRLVKAIADQGELHIEVRPGRNHTNLFIIPDLTAERVTPVTPLDTEEKVTSSATKGDIQGVKGDIAVSPEPSVNHQEPSPLADTTNVSADEGDLKSLPRRRVSASKDNHNTAREALEIHFQTITGLKIPTAKSKKELAANGALWWTPLIKILEEVSWDLDAAKRVIGLAVQYMLKENLTISSPKSVVSNARSEVGKMARTRASPGKLPGATIYRPPSGRPNGG